MSKVNYVSLKMLAAKGKRPSIKVYDTIPKTVDALDDLGLCCNWALANEVQGLCLLYYEGYTSPSSPERFVRLPFKIQDLQIFATKFKILLWQIFSPFIDKERSFIRIKTVRSGRLEGFVSVKILLAFATDCYTDVCKALDLVDDSKESSHSTIFYLD